MKKVRIVKQTFNKRSTYVIQQKHFLFRWWWVDGWMNSSSGANCIDRFRTLEEAKRHLIYFDGTKRTQEVVYD